MNQLLTLGEHAGELLKTRGERIVVAETSAGGLVSTALLAVPGASVYYVGGAITYSLKSIHALAGIDMDVLQKQNIRSSSEPYAQILARTIREKHPRVTWGLSESGAAGPTGNRYGDPAGHTCMAVDGPVKLVRTLRTGQSERYPNMLAFAQATLALLIEALESAPRG
ncbi:CinA family protein [Panacagrimonas sp.]|uniref:CinA family protein n=1 Tax=Panacagrimonas sp. TaxID=2480088 RepID=UPI003B52926B